MYRYIIYFKTEILKSSSWIIYWSNQTDISQLLNVAFSPRVVAGGFTYLKGQFPTISFKAYFPLIKPNPYYLLEASKGSVFKSLCCLVCLLR